MHQYISVNNLANLQGKFFLWTQQERLEVDLLSTLWFSLQKSWGNILKCWKGGDYLVHSFEYLIQMTLEILMHEYFCYH